MHNTEILAKLDALGFITRKAKLHGHIYKCPTIFKPNKVTGWYIISDRFIQYGDWREAIKQGWFWIDEPRQFTEQEKQEYKEQLRLTRIAIIKQQAADEQARQEKINQFKNQVLPIISRDNKTHAYLTRKQAEFRHDFITDKHNNLIIPMYNVNNNIIGYQFINEAGDKCFKTGSTLRGAFYPLLNKKADMKLADIFIFCEGYATADAIDKLMTEYTDSTFFVIIVTFSAHNINEVIRQFDKHYPKQDKFIIADNDEAGIVAAQKAKKDYYTMHYADGKDANDALLEFGIRNTLELLNNHFLNRIVS